ncbi:chorismate synthase [Helicobacter monodelphidis]|uniref:chorismate synthase n=1 Tax=Helicobacter sp. 15-1451 TaxID=2004995 RepID=UPI000DCE272F|nr:chorismate synthase [Helicobacter sp. 15-1451]RAX57617.1 chorismate synthase [Helicobacter sp. 15-1451]
MNTLGLALRISTFGESHGAGIGCVIDGLPAGLKIDEEFIYSEMQRRTPGRNIFSTQRKESDRVEILSGVFESHSTGAPIALWIANQNQKSSDYKEIQNIFRPSHADWTYQHKYNIRDYRGGGRASARESAARVAAGAIAKLLLQEIGIEFQSGIFSIGETCTEERDFTFAKTSEIYALDSKIEESFKKEILQAKNNHDSIGAGAEIRALKVPLGLGEPLYHKLDAQLAAALMGLNGVKAVEIGTGTNVAKMRGSVHNDSILPHGFSSNHSGGILGGISNGDTLVVRIYFKPTPSIFLPQQTLNSKLEPVEFSLKGRHDPCIGIRGVVVAESLVALVLADMAILNLHSQLSAFKQFYNSIHNPFSGGKI